MDLTTTTEARSDQKNYDDFIAGPRVFTIESVTPGSAEQPVHVNLVGEQGKPWKPSKSMRRVLVAAWGADGDTYAGRRIELYGDPTVRYAGKEVGGIRISAMSHLPKPLTVALTATRGKRVPFTVQPLPDAPTPPPVPAFSTMEQARAYYQERANNGAPQDELAAIQAAAQNLTTTTQEIN